MRSLQQPGLSQLERRLLVLPGPGEGVDQHDGGHHLLIHQPHVGPQLGLQSDCLGYPQFELLVSSSPVIKKILQYKGRDSEDCEYRMSQRIDVLWLEPI